MSDSRTGASTGVRFTVTGNVSLPLVNRAASANPRQSTDNSPLFAVTVAMASSVASQGRNFSSGCPLDIIGRSGRDVSRPRHAVTAAVTWDPLGKIVTRVTEEQ